MQHVIIAMNVVIAPAGKANPSFGGRRGRSAERPLSAYCVEKLKIAVTSNLGA